MPQPDNPKLFNALTNQAMAKYPSYKTAGLSPSAGKWRQNEYLKQGGSFVQDIRQVDPKKRDFKQEAIKKQKAHIKYKKEKIKKSGFVA
jgi:hypothetical protein